MTPAFSSSSSGTGAADGVTDFSVMGRLSTTEGRVRIAIVIPAHDEAGTIESVLREIPATTPEVLYQVFVCDDASTDGTGDLASASGATVVKHPTNLGIGAALATGFSAARAWNPDVYVQMDADGQHDPALIPWLLEPILRGQADYVIGSRFLTGARGLSPVRRVGVWFYSQLVSVLGRFRISDVTSGFRAFRPGVYDRIRVRARKNWAIEVTLRAGLGRLRTVEISTPFRPREGGRSQFDVRRLFLQYHYRASIQILRAIVTHDSGRPPPASPRILRPETPFLATGGSPLLVDSISRGNLAREPVDQRAPHYSPLSIAPFASFEDRGSPEAET